MGSSALFLAGMIAEFEQAALQRVPPTRAEFRDMIDAQIVKLQAMAIAQAIPMDVARWLNCWKILRSIDHFDLREIMSPAAFEHWRTNPAAWLALQDDTTAAKVWTIVIARGG